MNLRILFLLLLFPVSVSAQRFVKSLDTIAALRAANPNDIHTNVFVAGYRSANDGGQGNWSWIAGDTTGTNYGTIMTSVHASAPTGRWKRQVVGSISAEAFGATGDGSTDDSAYLTNAVVIARGMTLTFGNAKTYKITQALAATNIVLDLNGSTLNFVLDGDKEALQARDNTIVRNGRVVVTGSNLGGTGGNWHTPIMVGQAYENVGYTNVILQNLYIEGNRNNGNGIFITADSHDVVVENIVFPSSSTMGRCVLAHWATEGDGPDADDPSTHPYNMTIRNIKAGTMTVSAGDDDMPAIVFLSAVYNTTVDNVQAERSANAVVAVSCGSWGNVFASATVSNLLNKSIVIRNAACNDTRGYGVYVKGIADAAVFPSPKPRFSMPVLVENCKFIGNGASSTRAGFRATDCFDTTFVNCEASQFLYGFDVGEFTKRIHVIGSRAFENQQHGVYVSHSSIPEDITVSHGEFYSNGQDAGTTSAGILVGEASRPRVFHNILGHATPASETTQDWGIRISSVTNHVYAHMIGNYVRSVSGTAYSIGDSSSLPTLIWEFDGNLAASAIVTKRGGLTHVPIRRVVNSAGEINTVAVTATAAPTLGTWVAGDTIYFETVVAGNSFANVCTVGGSPGTWISVLTYLAGTQNRLVKFSSSSPFYAETTGLTETGTQFSVGQRVVFSGGEFVVSQTAVQSLSAGSTIPNSGNATVLVAGNGGAVTLTSTPTIADGIAGGQILTITGTSANTVTLQDEGTLPGSNIQLGAATRVLGQGDILVMEFYESDSFWYERSFSDN